MSSQFQAARRYGVRAVVGAAILALILSHRDTARQVWSALSGVSPLVLAGAAAFYLAGQALCAWRWQILLRARGVKVSFWTCGRIYLAGMFGNLWLPTGFGGDALRTALLGRAASVSLADAAASILAERLTGFAMLLSLGFSGLIWRGASAQGTSILWGAALLSALLALGWKLSGRLAASRTGKLASLRAALDFYAQPQTRGAVAAALAISLVFQVSQVVLNFALARASGLDLPALTFWWLVPLLSLSGLVPAGIGGLGVREGAALALLRGPFPHLEAGQIVAWSLLCQATVWLASLPGALFLRGKK